MNTAKTLQGPALAVLCSCQFILGAPAYADSEDRVAHPGDGTAAARARADCTAVADVVANVTGWFTFARKDQTQSVTFHLDADSRTSQVSPALIRSPLKADELIDYEIFGPSGQSIGGSRIIGPDDPQACQK